MSNTIKELLYILNLNESGETYDIVGFAERKYAEEHRLRHLTVIIVGFISDGKDKGKWVVHDRTEKQLAKGKKDAKSPSYNLIGGHVMVDMTDMSSVMDLAGKNTSSVEIKEICLKAAQRELNEELYLRGWTAKLAVLKNGIPTNNVITVSPYKHKPLIYIGISTYESNDNVEVSYIYALPIPSSDYDKLVAADDYVDEKGKHRDIFLPISAYSECELKKLHQDSSISNAEVCDAITRLWSEENEYVCKVLLDRIYQYGTCGDCGLYSNK
jgi:hypothetical protein